MYTTIGTYYSIIIRINTNCCIHTVVPSDDGHRYARNMYRSTKYAKNKLCIKLVFDYTKNVYIAFSQLQQFVFQYRVINKVSDSFSSNINTCFPGFQISVRIKASSHRLVVENGNKTAPALSPRTGRLIS